ncbi:archaea-specific SMC-related protein [Halosolutus gelatinilyticus]|uniref:archaea-specific SMC-related protein n=1 Tax=Halosolutus gelatinilyticus TaxID=2931975 RepID=UPI001FF55F9A|nr:archaea-specific SMC-related protein [Halosolutus gelatinilyticus]
MTWALSLANIAGIREGRAELSRGVNAIRASNWQGKSSFLAGIETAMGTATPLTEGEERGHAVLETSDDAYRVELRRENGRVVSSGSPFLTDEYGRVCAELFAFLDETNPVRQAVRNGDNLEDVLTRPLDFENIDERIAELQREREQVDAELEQAETAAERLPSLESTVAALESDLEDLRDRREELDAAGAAGDDESGNKLSEARADRDQLERRIRRLEETLRSARERRSTLREELDALDVDESDELEASLSTARSELRDRERDLELLQSIYEANKRMLDEDRLDLLAGVSRSLTDDAADCWICGQETTRDAIESSIAELGERVRTLQDDAESYRDRVDELQSRMSAIESQRKRKRRLESDLREAEETISTKNSQLETARDRRDELETEIDDLEESVQEATDERAEVESEIKYLEAELDDASDELDRADRRASKRPQLEDARAEISDELTTLRERKETIERETRETFEREMRELVDEFEIGFEVARLTGSFELVIAREGRETTVDALSEGEVELVGLVVALAAHEAFEVDDLVPVILLDGLGSLASDNLARFAELISERAPFIVLTAYPESESIGGREIDPAGWDVVSRELHAGSD